MRFRTGITKRQFIVLTGLLVVMMGIFFAKVIKDCRAYNEENITEEYIKPTTVTGTIEPVNTERDPLTVTEGELEEVLGDPNNYIYPFNQMSSDWGAELYESGFRYYQIPQKYVDEGGCFPEVVQAYLWCICEEAGVDYYMVVALIERESHYRYDCVGDAGNSKGYMQVYEKYHLDLMERVGVEDLFDPYGNIRVGIEFLKYIQGKYLDNSGANCVLMVYNMGETGAKRNWSKGIYSTEYSRAILKRAQEIKQELQDQ